MDEQEQDNFTEKVEGGKIKKESSKKISTSQGPKRSNAKMSTGSMVAGSFCLNHSERRKKVSKIDSFDIPKYPDEESKKRALEAAMQTELEFLEFAESLKLPPDHFLPSPIHEESPSSILREWRNNGLQETYEQNEDQDKENTSPRKDTMSDPNVTLRQKRSSRSPSFSNNNRQKVGLDHLENLVRLMEELSNLRDQNTKLQRKVQDMECEKVAKEQPSSSEAMFIPNERSRSSIASFSIQNSPEVAVKILNKIAMIQQEQNAEGVPMKPKKISDARPQGARNKNGKVLTRSPRLEEGEEMNSHQSHQLQTSVTCPAELGSHGSKMRGSAWTKVKDAFKRELQESASPQSTRSTRLNQSSSKTNLESGQTEPKVYGEFSSYLPPVSSSSCSSDQEDIQFDLYNINFDLVNELSVQRSSSFSQVSELLPNYTSSPSLYRRHSMNSLLVDDGVHQPAKEEKKVTKSAWGKVKNMIYTRRDSLKKKDVLPSNQNQYTKKPAPYTRKRTTSLSNSKPSQEDECEYLDPSGIWMGPPDKRHPKDSPRLIAKQISAKKRPMSEPKLKPQLTLTFSTPDEQQCSIVEDTEKTTSNPEDDVMASTPNSESVPLPSGIEISFDQGIISEKSKHANSCSPQAIRSGPSKQDDSSWANKVKKVWTTKREEELATNSMSLPNSPLRNSAVFLYDENNISNQVIDEIECPVSTSNYPPTKDSSGSQSSGDWHGLQGEIQKNYELLQRRLSEEFQRKMQQWEKGRTSKDSMFLPNSPMLSRSRSAQAGPGELELHLSPDFKRKYDEWQKMKQENHGNMASPPPTLQQTENVPTKIDETVMTPATRKKIRSRPLGEQVVQNESDLKPEFRLKVAEWEVRKALAGHGCKNVEEIRKLMPEDFNKKLKEWEQIKENVGTKVQNQLRDERKNSMPVPESVKKSTNNIREDKSKPVKLTEALCSNDEDSLWIEKELKQIKREKLKLEIDREKCMEKEARLEKIREALTRGVCHEKEITVKTSKGEEFKFCGISDTFTRKLFEWEESRGIAPESSTIALLNNPFSSPHENTIINKCETIGSPIKKEGNFKRARSEGSLPDSANDEKQIGKSKRSSEGNLSQNSPQSVSDLEKQARSLRSVTCDASAAKTGSKPKHGAKESDKVSSKIQDLNHYNHTWDLLLHIEQLLSKLQHQAYQLHNCPQDKIGILNTIHDLRQTTHIALKHQASRHRLALANPNHQHLSQSYSDLSCGELSNKYAIASDNESRQSAASSSHSMSRYGSESPLYSVLMTDLKTLDPKTNFELLHQLERDVIEEASQSSEDENQNELGKDFGFGYMGETDEEENDRLRKEDSTRNSLSPENNKCYGYRIIVPKRRTSSENISTPNSGRSRSPSLLSSEFIPEEEDCLDIDETEELEEDRPVKTKSVIKKPDSDSDVGSGMKPPTTDMDQLYQLVHELKEKDLNYHKNLIAQKEAAKRALVTSQSTVVDDYLKSNQAPAVGHTEEAEYFEEENVQSHQNLDELVEQFEQSVYRNELFDVKPKESPVEPNDNDDENFAAFKTDENRPVSLNVFVQTSKTVFSPLDDSNEIPACSYSVFLLQDNPVNTEEWEPESDPQYLICPAKSIEEIPDEVNTSLTTNTTSASQEGEGDEAGVSISSNMKPSLVKRNPNCIPMSEEGKRVAESHTSAIWRTSETILNPKLESLKADQNMKRTTSGSNLLTAIHKHKEPLCQTKSLPVSIPDLPIKESREVEDMTETVSELDKTFNENLSHCQTTLEGAEATLHSRSDWQYISKERSKQLMKAKEQFFLGKGEVQRVIVTSKEIVNVVEEVKVNDISPNKETTTFENTILQSEENKEKPSSENVEIRTHLFLRNRKPNLLSGCEGGLLLPSSVAFRRSLFEPKNGTLQAENKKGSESALNVPPASVSCPSSPNLTPRTRKKTPFNWNPAKQGPK